MSLFNTDIPSFFGFGSQQLTCQILLDNAHRQRAMFETAAGEKLFLPLFRAGDFVEGEVVVKTGKRVEHNGIDVDIVGSIGLLVVCLKSD